MARYLGILLALFVASSVTYARSVTEPQAEDKAPIRDEMALIIYTDEEIAAAIKFMTLAPHATDPDRIKELMMELCDVMRKVHPSAADSDEEQQDESKVKHSKTLEEQLAEHKIQFWGSENKPSIITKANLAALKQMCLSQ